MDQRIAMSRTDTKKCRIVPQRNRFVPDLLLNNQRIEEETTMEINVAEIQRAMSIAEVYEVAEDGSETLLDEFNFFLKSGEAAEEEKEPTAQAKKSTPASPPPVKPVEKDTQDTTE